MNDDNEHESFIPDTLDTGKPEISMAPLIDVVFLLLIFFMVTTVFPENKGLIISKPEAENTKQLSPKQLEFLIDKNNKVYFQKNEIEMSDVKRIVKEELLQKPDLSILLKVDKQSTTEIFIKTMDACKSGGAKNIAIATDAIEDRNTI